MISIEDSTEYIAFPSETQAQRSTRYVETQIELLRNSIVVAPILARPEIAAMADLQTQADPVEYLISNLTIKPIGKSNLYDVRFVSSSPKDAQNVVNAVISEYLSRQTKEEFRRTQRVIDVLEEERVHRSQEVEALRRRVVELAKEVTGRDPFGQGALTDPNMALSPLGGLFQSLTELEVRREILKAELQAVRDAPALADDEAVVATFLDLEISARPDVRELRAKADALQMEMQRIKAASLKWETQSDYVRLNSEHEQINSVLAELTDKLRQQFVDIRKQERDQKNQLEAARMERELAALAAQEKMLNDKIESYSGQLKDGGAQSVQLEFARAELAREERVFELIAARKLALQTELRAPGRVEPIQEASLPGTAIEPVPYKTLLMGCTISLLAPFSLALLRELTIKKISTLDEVLQSCQMRVLGEVSRFPVRPVASKQEKLGRRAQQEMFIFAESIDSIRTNLMLSEAMAGHAENRVIAICSAASGEGKTSVATSLTVSFAGASKKRTLLIDADLRSPEAAAVLGVANRPGLAELLAGKNSLEEVIQRVGATNAYVLPAGRCKGSPHHLVQPSVVNRLLNGLKEKFTTIIIDTPPVLSASESLVYAKAADLVVYCTLRDVSQASQLRSAVSRLHDAGVVFAGAVLSGVPCSTYAQHYGVYGNLHSVSNDAPLAQI